MLWKETQGDQLFVYWNGELIFKRWLKGHGFGGHNAVFELYGPPAFFWDQNLDRERGGGDENGLRRHVAAF